jgi:hypothetical protein
VNAAPRIAISLAWLVLASGPLAQTSASKEPDELARLRQQYHQRREAALKPVNASYRQQLELLLKSLMQRNQLDAALVVRKEIESLEAIESGEADLRIALLHWKWSWSGDAKETDVFMDFRDDGTVSHRGMKGTWRIVGPREIKLVESDDTGGRTFKLRFNTALDSYESVSGPTLQGKRKPKK